MRLVLYATLHNKSRKLLGKAFLANLNPQITFPEAKMRHWHFCPSPLKRKRLLATVIGLNRGNMKSQFGIILEDWRTLLNFDPIANIRALTIEVSLRS
jgi:hypothetical protein